MSKRKMILLAAMVGAMVAVPVGAATAGTVKAGGGLWSYGVTSSEVYSHYFHADYYHTATACNGDLFTPCVQAAGIPGEWANAAKNKNYLGGNEAFWSTLE